MHVRHPHYVASHKPLPERECPSAPPTTAPRFPSLGETLLEALDRVGYGGLVVDGDGNVSAINAAGRRMIEHVIERRPGAQDRDWLCHAVRRLQNRATPWFPRDAEAWATISSAGESGVVERPLAMYRVPLAEGEGANRSCLLILADFSAVPQPKPATLRRIFGLTAAEAKVAVQIGRGDMLADIAGEHGVSVATVRSQLASVFAKTQTRRQTELAMLLARIAILP
jgi:DNA-binding CsgD family transcriptional regulator